MQGELVANSSITHDFEATVFDWHPTERILAIGWGDGMMLQNELFFVRLFLSSFFF